MIQTFKNFLEVIFFFFSLWKEQDSLKAKEKAEIAKEIVNAFQETDKNIQASRLNGVIMRINRLHF